MTATAVVTGSSKRVEEVSRAFASRGISVQGIDCDGDLERTATRLPARSVDYYVQLPGDVPSPGSTKSRAVAALLDSGLLRRFREAEALLPALAPRCAVVLVTGETVSDLPGGGYPHGPTCVLEMLADAIATDMSPEWVSTTVVGHEQSADGIADIALATGPDRGRVTADFAARGPEMRYDDWKLACMTAAGPEV